MNWVRTSGWMIAVSALGVTAACGSSDDGDPDPTATGGAVNSGGLPGTGATASTGGVSAGGGAATGGAVTSGGTTGAGGATASGGFVATGGAVATGGSVASGGAGGATGTGGVTGTGGATGELAKFSFFVTSLKAIQRESGSQSGFGGDLTLGETGVGAGLRGADKLCTKIAEVSMPGSGAKQWRAFLSARSAGDGGTQVNAIDRVGAGPWYDRLGRLVAQSKANLGQTRPVGADALIINDLPNEDGVPNHAPVTGQGQVDNHDVLTGSDTSGKLYGTGMGPTCNDWTSAVGTTGKPRVGHSWPRGSGGGFPGGGGMENWMSALDEAGCAPGVNVVEMGPPNPFNPTVGSGGGYGGIYCLALTP